MRRIGDRLERRAAGIGDRRRRQAVDQIGVVGRRLVDVGLVDRAVGRLALAAEQAVDDRRVGLQPHALVQPVDEDGGDARALVAAAGFLLDDRGQRDEFVDVGERQVRRRAVPRCSSTSFFWSASILSMICWRVVPRVKRCVSVARLPSGGISAGMSPVSASCSAMRCERLLDRQPFREWSANTAPTCRSSAAP